MIRRECGSFYVVYTEQGKYLADFNTNSEAEEYEKLLKEQILNNYDGTKTKLD